VSELNGWEKQLSELLKVAAGEPRRPVSMEMVRRRLVRRRVTVAAAAVAMAVLMGGIGAAVASTTGGSAPAGGSGRVPGVPSYYIQDAAGHRLPVVRSRVTGAVTATVRCPGHGTSIALSSIAAASSRTFFVVCEQQATQGSTTVVAVSRIYRLRLTVSGRIRGHSLVNGGTLRGLRVDGIAVTADGSEIAVTVAPGTATHVSSASDDVLVINARTGTRARWRASGGKPGTISYLVRSMSLTANGRELAFLTQPRCVPRPNAPKCHVRGGEEVRVLSPADSGGQVSHSRLLVKQSSIMRLAVGYINDAVISQDGSLVTVAEVGWPAGDVSIAQVSAATGKQVRFVFRLHTGSGFSYRAFAADPSVRHFILVAGPAGGPISNGWIDHGRLISLKPRDGTNVSWEVW
jgi:hypothetical protein